MYGATHEAFGLQGAVRPGETSRDRAPPHPIRDFMVEICGILLPGFAFTTGVVGILAIPLHTLAVSQRDTLVLGANLAEIEVWSLIGAIKLPIVMAAAALSYVLGHVFARQDLKLPDTISYWCLPERSRRTDLVGCYRKKSKGLPGKRWHDHIWEAAHVFDLCEKIELGQSKRYPCLIKFPYFGFRKWLDAQGILGIARLDTKARYFGNRSKLFDLVKIAIGFEFPAQCLQLTRIEAHVRLASSIWYASCELICLAVIGVFLGVLANGLAKPYAVPYPAALLVPGLALVVLVWQKRSIERSLHSMRVREIEYVLAHLRCAAAITPKIVDALAVPLPGVAAGAASKPEGAAQCDGEHLALACWSIARTESIKTARVRRRDVGRCRHPG